MNNTWDAELDAAYDEAKGLASWLKDEVAKATANLVDLEMYASTGLATAEQVDEFKQFIEHMHQTNQALVFWAGITDKEVMA